MGCDRDSDRDDIQDIFTEHENTVPRANISMKLQKREDKWWRRTKDYIQQGGKRRGGCIPY